MDDFINAAESHLLDWLNADPDVTANYIHVKIVKDINSYNQKQLPAIGIFCTGGNREDDNETKIVGFFEITASGALATADSDCKKTIAQIVNSLKKGFVPGINRGKYFKSLRTTNFAVTPIPLTQGFYIQGLVYFELELVH